MLHRRRNIFELYIEEVAEACKRLKGGKLSAEALKKQLHDIAKSRTGGEKTDEILGKGEHEGLPHSIIMTPEGPEGEVPELGVASPPEAAPQAAPAPEPPEKQAPRKKPRKAPKPKKKRAPAKKTKKRRKR